MMDRRRLIAALAVAAAVGLVATRFLRAAGETATVTRANACRALAPDPVPVALQNREAPDFDLPDASGKRWSLSKLRGRPVLLNFWATWCGPCVEEMPSMEDLSRGIGDKAVVLAVSVDEDWATIRRFFPKGTPLSVLLDQSKEVPKRYGTEKYPESFLIDAEGRVRHYFINKRPLDSGGPGWGGPEAVECLESVR